MYFLKKSSIEDDINIRIAALLRNEREAKICSIRRVARKLKISRADIVAWESGRRSPPANVYYRMICFYGKRAYKHASELNLTLQLEKNQRLQHSLNKRVRDAKIPAVIFRENCDLPLAA